MTRTLTPVSNTSTVILPSTGSAGDVISSCPFNVYSDPESDLFSLEFCSGAAEQVTYTYRMLGGDVLDIELTPDNIYSCYEEATLEYSYILNLHQAKNILSNVLGSSTGSFDHDGQITGSLSSSLGGLQPSLSYPKLSLSYARRMSEAYSSEVSIGRGIRIYSASFSVVTDVQDYDIQGTIYSQSLDTTSDFYGRLSDGKSISIRKVFYKTNNSMWRFFGYYGGLNTVGNLSSYGQYSDDTTFQVVPVWQNRLQSQAFEDSIFVRNSHYSYELRDNRLRLFPVPVSSYPEYMWIEFTIEDDNAWTDELHRDLKTTEGVNNMNTLPFSNIPYGNINAIGKQWIRRYALACSKGVLSQVRGKFSEVPIPGQSITLNSERLATESREEMDKLREELKEILDQLTYSELSKRDAEMADSSLSIQQKIPNLIFVG